MASKKAGNGRGSVNRFSEFMRWSPGEKHTWRSHGTATRTTRTHHHLGYCLLSMTTLRRTVGIPHLPPSPPHRPLVCMTPGVASEFANFPTRQDFSIIRGHELQRSSHFEVRDPGS